MNDEVKELIDGFNSISKNAGVVSFKVKYTATPGNREIHKEFAEFCFDFSNNNYLEGISKLMDNKKFSDRFERNEDRLSVVEMKLEGLRDLVLEQPKPEEKTTTEEKGKTF